MKIVHISHLYHPSSGGVQFFFKNVSERLVKDYGDDVTVVTTNSFYGPERKIFKKVEPAEEIINGVKVIRFPYWRWHISLYSFIYKICSVLKIKFPDQWALQSQGPYSPQMKKYLTTVEADAFCGSSSNYYFMQLPLWRRCNFFYYGSIHLHQDESKDRLYTQQLQSMNASTLYLANTNYEKERMIKLGVKREKVFVLGSGVDMEPFTSVHQIDARNYKTEIGIPADALVIGYVGRIEQTKSVKVVIEAFEKLAGKFPKAHLLIAGSGSDYVEQLKSYANALDESISRRIHFQVSFPLEKKGLLFNCLDILVLPSRNESFGLVFVEAWSCRKPVIGAAIGAVKDVIAEGVDGLLMEIDNADSLSEKLATLLSDEDLRKEMGEKGFEKVKENYTWDIIVARLRQCYLNANKKGSNKTVVEKKISYV